MYFFTVKVMYFQFIIIVMEPWRKDEMMLSLLKLEVLNFSIMTLNFVSATNRTIHRTYEYMHKTNISRDSELHGSRYKAVGEKWYMIERTR